MSCRNPYKYKIQKVVNNWLGMFSVERKISDDQMECMQFGICSFSPKSLEEIPYFHY